MNQSTQSTQSTQSEIALKKLKDLIISASAGDLNSQISLARFYQEGQIQFRIWVAQIVCACTTEYVKTEKDYDMSMHWCNIALQNGDCIDEDKCEVMYLIANNLFYQGKYDASLNYRAYVYTYTTNTELRDAAYLSIAEVYTKQNDNRDFAIYEYFVNRTEPIVYPIIRCLSNYMLGNIYTKLKDYAKSAIHYSAVVDAIDIFKTGATNEQVSMVYNNLGYAYENIGKYKLAIVHYGSSAHLGNHFANLSLWHIYSNKYKGIRKNYAKAAQHYERGKASLKEWQDARSL